MSEKKKAKSVDIGAEDGVDLQLVLREIDEEVRAKRASGELPVELERELDVVFSRFAPPGALGGNFDQLLDRAEQQSFIDLVAPNESARPAVPQVKRVVQKTMRWYLRFVAEQFTGFSHTLIKAMRQLGKRVDAVEALRAPEQDFEHILPQFENEAVTQWQREIVELMKGVDGRVLHARCGDGTLIKALKDAGVDAYGSDPAISSNAAASSGPPDGLVMDLRADDEVKHLQSMPSGALGGIVLSAGVEFLPRGSQVELTGLAAGALKAGGTLVIATITPQQWNLRQSPVVADLSPGSPMHPATWSHLLAERGFTSIEIRYAHRDLLDVVLGEGDVVDAVNAQLARISELLCPAPSALIIARR